MLFGEKTAIFSVSKGGCRNSITQLNIEEKKIIGTEHYSFVEEFH